MPTIIEREYQSCAHNYHSLPLVLVRGKGTRVWDENGREYLDFMSAYSAVSFGHGHPRILKRMFDQASQLTIVSRAYHTDQLSPFAEKICDMTGLESVLPMNTGAEGVETAIKAARKWGYDVKGIPSGKAKIVVCSQNFHGRTTTIVGFSSDKVSKKGFEPFSGGFDPIPFGDVKALENAIDEHTCAFLVEPIQGEAGIVVPPKGYLKAVQKICQERNVLLILDEVQTGVGRTGKNFAFQYEIDKPDALIVGKAIGGGAFPVSAFVAKKEVMDVFSSGSHGSTWGGNPLGMAIAHESLCVLEDENLAEKSAKLGEYLMKELKKIKSPLVKEVRGKGLFVGLELKESAKSLCLKLLHKGILSKDTHETVIRFAPPLVITKEEINYAVTQVRDALLEMEQDYCQS